MKKLAIVLLLAAAGCRRQAVVGSTPGANTPGGATPREAAQRFMAAAKSQDLQAMSIVWGSKDGPIRDTRPKDEVEKREIIMMTCLKHDSYQVVTEAPAAGGERVLAVEIKYKDLTRSTNFNAVPGPSNRWFVRQVDLTTLTDICQKK